MLMRLSAGSLCAAGRPNIPDSIQRVYPGTFGGRFALYGGLPVSSCIETMLLSLISLDYSGAVALVLVTVALIPRIMINTQRGGPEGASIGGCRSHTAWINHASGPRPIRTLAALPCLHAVDLRCRAPVTACLACCCHRSLVSW